jgi:hypothetical protein
MAVKMSVFIFRVVLPSRLVGRYQRFRGTSYLSIFKADVILKFGDLFVSGFHEESDA